jgi:citrate synthase
MAKRFLSADEAAEMLGVSKATLYAYVSRGFIRSEAVESSTRERRYLAQDVRKLSERKEYRRNPAKLAQNALNWGTPLLDSSLTLIADEGLYYRGHNALAFARTASLEEVAALLWTDDIQQAQTLFPLRPATAAVLERLDSSLAPMQRLTVVLALAAGDDFAAYDLSAEAVTRTGSRILALMAAALTGQPYVGSLAEHLRRAWRPGDPYVEALFNAALILCVDHELNASSFTARVVASAGANPYAVVTAGLAALGGYKHGGNTERVEGFLREIGTPDRIERTTAERLRRGERIPGFGHSLYPNGDPRAKALFSLLWEAYPDSAEVQFSLATAERVASMIEHQPNIDFALVSLARAARLPDGAALALFALGRTVGWIAHAIEQYASDVLIRPRARYVGRLPVDDL